MDKETINRTCITNMEEKDPIINKYMNEYMKSVQEYEDIKGTDKLIVNFDITYPDGRCENFTCNGISEVFGNKNIDSKDNKEKCCIENKNEKHEDKKKKKCLSCEEKEIEKCKKYSQDKDYYCEDEKCNEYDYNIQNEYADFFDEYKKNFEYVKSNKNQKYNDNKADCQKDYKYEKEDIEEGDGQINVYAYLGVISGIELKGVSVNLYKINGICPELVDCKQTDSNGKVCFENVKEGSYRIIELIDKNYFSRPTYVNWNEVNITKDNKCFTIYVINKMK